MKHSKYHQKLGETAACTKRIMEATKVMGQNYRKGVINDCFILAVVYPQSSQKTLQWKLPPS